ncbi:hypothetical protein CLOLEP_02237 [[Clostridium] leptum DSM 753]|uniref:Uncharacterized protein n=1 Tax=[Clostridium] leptum DSM 753 TaxID=428125 RepID=A7VUJ1_9FIRM|nr:hypothetical protein CLOLEP_02237 [[Clostridium] leptum DSM 753]
MHNFLWLIIDHCLAPSSTFYVTAGLRVGMYEGIKGRMPFNKL